MLVGIYPAWEGRASVVATFRAVVGSGGKSAKDGNGGKTGESGVVVQVGGGGSEGSVSSREKGGEGEVVKGM